jgi:hypothetical protein
VTAPVVAAPALPAGPGEAAPLAAPPASAPAATGAAPTAAPVIQVFVVLEPLSPAQVASLAQSKAGAPASTVVKAPILVAGAIPKGSLEAPAAEVKTQVAPTAPAPAAAPAPPPYSLPWQLRPATLGNVARLDTALASDEEPDGKSGVTQVATLLVSRKLTPHLMPLLRIGAARNVTPAGLSRRVLLNPILGLVYGRSPVPGLHAAGFFALAPPFGTGGGDDASPAAKAALRSGGSARSGMDGAMFAVNDLGVLLGGDLALVRGRSTIQVEATLIQLRRMRAEKAQPDANRTNLTSGVHLGHFVHPQISLGGELRYQRWLSTPAAVAADPTGASRDLVTAALGARLHAKLGGTWVRPGVSLTTALDAPLSSRHLTVVQIDLPVVF